MSNNKNVPAYLVLVLSILETAEAEGLSIERNYDNTSSLPENDNFCFVFVGGGNAAMIVPKHADRVKWLDSHIEWEGNEGYLPHPTGKNGTVICRLNPAKLDLAAFLHALDGASKRDRKSASKQVSKESMDSFTAKLAAVGNAKKATPGVTVRKPEPELTAASQDDDDSDGTYIEA